MAEPEQVEIVAPAALGAADREAWAAFRAANPALDHPYFDLRYTLAAACAPGAAVAVVRRAGSARAFFPFQRRGRLIQPLGAPLTDYHGVIAPAGETVDLAALVRAVGGAGLRVNGWLGGGAGSDWTGRARMVCDLTGGPPALEARFDARDHKFCKNLRRAHRAFERDHGPARFVWNDRDPAVLDWVIARKREQYRRTRRHDVFACGWTADLLRRLFEAATPEFGLRLVSLRTAAGDLVAGEISMVGDGLLHLWFPAYADAYRRYGPGTLLTRLELDAAAAAGLRAADFGCGEESYKSTFAEPCGEVLEGAIAGPLTSGAAALLRDRAPAPVRRLAGSVGRRLYVINACETRPAAWLAGTLAAAGAAARSLAPQGS